MKPKKRNQPTQWDIGCTIGVFFLALIFLSISFKKATLLVFILAGFIAFVYYQQSITTLKKSRSKKHRKKYQFLKDTDDFTNVWMLYAAAVIGADDEISDTEILYLKKSLRVHYKENEVQDFIRRIKKLSASKTIQTKALSQLVIDNFTLQEKVQLMHFLIGIVSFDGLLKDAEMNKLKQIAIEIKLPFKTFEYILKMFNYRTEQDFKDRQNRKQYTSAYQLKKAYELLGIAEDATEKQIKKAYRKLALIHHPDRVIHLSESLQIQAKEKFQIILDAYEMIKEKKGFA